MEEYIHEVLHVAAATLFIVAGVSAFWEYRNLKERVIWSFGLMALFSAGYACHVVISHNLPKSGSFWIPWTSFNLATTFAATFFYLLTLHLFIGRRGKFYLVPLVVLATLTLTALVDLTGYLTAGSSFLFLPIARELPAHQTELGEAAYTLRPFASIVAGLFFLCLVCGIIHAGWRAIRKGSKDYLLYAGLLATLLLMANDVFTAMSVYEGLYLMAFSKSFETVRIHRDIRLRARESIERRLRQAEKMESIGRVAGGIAHDFNNILMAVDGSVDLVREELPPEHPAQRYLQMAKEGIKSGDELAQQILDVARSKQTDAKRIRIEDFLIERSNLLSSLMPVGMRLEVEAQPNLGDIVIAPGELTQVLINLVVNAREAMPEGGTIHIKAQGLSVRFGDGHRGPVTQAVGITVSDQGVGIPEAVIENIFEPLFTTKEGTGSGLGLATLYSIVHKAGGRVEVDSRPNQGTRFQVLLPVAGA